MILDVFPDLKYSVLLFPVCDDGIHLSVFQQVSHQTSLVSVSSGRSRQRTWIF